MAAKLKEGKSIKREVDVYGIPAPVMLVVTRDGLKAYIKGTKIAIYQSWPQLIAAMNTPENVPSFLAGRALEFLKAQALKRQKAIADKE